MATENYFSGYLWITKKEEIANVEIGKDLKVLILESDVFPGYYAHDNFPECTSTLSEKFIYLVIKGHTHRFLDQIVRKIEVVRSKLKTDISACPGEISVAKKMSSCIRITNIETNLLKKVIKILEEEGIKFSQHVDLKPYNGFIHVKKWVDLKQLQDKIFQSITNSDEYYIEVPTEMEWNDFVTITMNTKNNCKQMLFDAALGTIYQKDSLKDFVRIYSKNISIKELTEIKDYYYKELSRYYS